MVATFVLLWLLSGLATPLAASAGSHHDATVAYLVADFSSSDPGRRARAAEKLGYLRAHGAADALASATRDPFSRTRREACLSLGWCGTRSHVPALLKALDDHDWTVRQAAWVALTNLTGMELPFAAHANPAERAAQKRRWESWWASVPGNGVPDDLLALLGTPPVDLADGRPVAASSTYKGPASILTDPHRNGFWQTKNVPFPQHCTIDLGQSRTIGCLAIAQYGKGFRMTDFSIATSRDGQSFQTLTRRKGITPTNLIVSFAPTIFYWPQRLKH